MTTTPMRMRASRSRISMLLCAVAMALTLGVTACAGAGGSGAEYLLFIAIGIAGSIATLYIASSRNQVTGGVVALALLLWPVGLLYVLTKAPNRQREVLGLRGSNDD